MNSLVSADTILTLAVRESGAFEAIDQGLLDRFRKIIEWINERGPYTSWQVDGMQRQIQQLLATRLRLAVDRERFPGIKGEVIHRPIFVVGFPRAGTTFLHSLLAEDTDALSLQSWHVYAPSPPPGAGPVCAQRIAFSQRQVEHWMDFCPGQRALHPYVDKGVCQLIEDEEIYSLDFRAAYAYHYYKVPTLDVISALTGDEVGGFRFHREFLQHSQWNTGKKHWACKGYSAQHYLEELFEVYPDALCVWPHRPVADILHSLITITNVVYDAIQGRPFGGPEYARATAETMKGAFDNLLAGPLVNDPRVMHVRFRDMSADPISTIKQIYARQGRAVTGEFEARMSSWLSDPENLVDRHGRYPYSYESIGLDKKWVEDLFADYSRYFKLDD